MTRLTLKRSLIFHVPLAACLGLLLALTTGRANAEIVSIEGTVKSVDADERTITVTRSTKGRMKDLDLEVSKKARISIDGESAGLDDIEPGQFATISFESELEVVTEIEVEGEGGDAPDGDMPRKPRRKPRKPGGGGELKDSGCQVIWMIDENGESTVTIGRPPADSEPAEEAPIRHDDGTVEFQHDLDTPDAVAKTFMSRAENTRFDRNVGALVLAPKAGRGGQAPQANFAYSKVTQLPIQVIFEFEGLGAGDSCLFGAQLRSSDDSDFPALKLFTEDGFATAAEVRPTWIIRTDRRGQPNTKPLMDEQLVELGEPQEFSFQMPVPDEATRYVLEFGVQGQDVPIALRRLSVRGRLTPTLGIALAQAGGFVVAERVLPNGLGEAIGVRSGDVIVSINGIKARSVQDAMDAMGAIQFGDEGEIIVRRGGRTIPIGFTAE